MNRSKQIYPFIIVFKLLYKEFLNFRGIIFLVSTILILSSLMLLKNYQVFFEDHYISYLKSIYPHHFTPIKKIKKIKIDNVRYASEAYHLALKDVKLYIYKDKSYLFNLVNIKSLV